MDWNSFKDQEGIHDELRNFNKDGFVIVFCFLLLRCVIIGILI